ncbi:antitoxin family protein [Iningainema tapete]|uniref:Antitoxin family protein n=1 Tax=Iningainema tapete BLCC-T55 TaxID=2748662 RepID=A0A8J6XTF8_9CYAN|nr:antitoxin family protein [Iningainema tapete]MBD2778144.1 antitoxin family protein [Iningainema tapete BLCC-T55]
MKQIVDAIYENGVFRPLKNPEISDGEKVRLTVETSSLLTPEEMLELAAQVYQDLSAEQVDEIEKIALERCDFFGEKSA